ncbi:hypothetical protein QOT17_007359 [Balamuthia mandrillaris]
MEAKKHCSKEQGEEAKGRPEGKEGDEPKSDHHPVAQDSRSKRAAKAQHLQLTLSALRELARPPPKVVVRWIGAALVDEKVWTTSGAKKPWVEYAFEMTIQVEEEHCTESFGGKYGELRRYHKQLKEQFIREQEQLPSFPGKQQLKDMKKPKNFNQRATQLQSYYWKLFETFPEVLDSLSPMFSFSAEMTKVAILAAKRMKDERERQNEMQKTERKLSRLQAKIKLLSE